MRIPIFPLPGVVLLPGTTLPLHIFEPRYRAMVADALSGDGTIGMAMLKPGWDESPDTPPIFAVGGAGRIVEAEQLPDGRYDIVLSGDFRYRVLEESPPAPYRVATVDRLVSTPFSSATRAAAVCSEAARLLLELSEAMELPPLPGEELDAERFASELALRLRYDPAELQALLETDSLPDRFDVLVARMREWRERIRFLAPFRGAQLPSGRN
ncbi:MAG TPA: LON peptidase substrate-binding domain-containing protein [Thermoanaerobaculia bacterium]|nr:LON peptidase substrate-binding domain-containing protein [Thermoanaerobaculia bacterium]